MKRGGWVREESACTKPYLTPHRPMKLLERVMGDEKGRRSYRGICLHKVLSHTALSHEAVGEDNGK